MVDEKEKDTQKQKDTTDTSTEDVKTGNEGGEEQTQSNSVPYERFQQVIEEKNDYKNELEQLKNKLEEMEDPEELKSEYETKLEKMENKSINREKEFALKEAALAEGVNKQALNDFAKVAELDKLEINDNGEVEGVNDLIETMKEEKSYFFSEEKEKGSSKSGSDFKDSGEGGSFEEGKDKLRKIMGIK